MAVTECVVLKEYGVVRLNAAIATKVAAGFTPHTGIMAGEDGWFLIAMKKETGVTATACVVVTVAGVERLATTITAALADGSVPFGNIQSVGDENFVIVLIAGLTGGDVSAPTWASITGKPAVIAAGADAAAARNAIGAGTSSLSLGATNTTAKAGDYAPTWAEVTGKPAIIAAGDTQAAARAAIGAGVGSSNLVVGTTATQAKAGNYQPTAANISDAGAFGRQLLQSADQAAAKALLGIA